ELVPRLAAPPAALHTSCTAPAGHNKWSKVKLIKGPWEAHRSWLFQKLAMPLCLLRKLSNPDLNANLANIIKQCWSKSMPKAAIESAIKGRVRSQVQEPSSQGRGAHELQPYCILWAMLRGIGSLE
ncbi:unnamed protein product, partial [Caretta caretta]